MLKDIFRQNFSTESEGVSTREGVSFIIKNDSQGNKAGKD